MGIYAAPPDRRRRALRVTDLCRLIAISLVFASLATFALVGAGVLGSAWLAIALGQALLALALVSQGSADPASPVHHDEEARPERPNEPRPSRARGQAMPPAMRTPKAPGSRSRGTWEQRPKQRV